MRDTRVQSLGWEDLLEKEMATHSNILAWRIPWTVQPGRLQSMGLQRVGHNWVTSLSLWASRVAQRLKRLPPMRETWARSLGWEDLLEKEMVTHSSILAWRVPWTEEPGRLQSTGSQKVGHNWATSLQSLWRCLRSSGLHIMLRGLIECQVTIRQGREAWCAAVHGVTKSRTWLRD